MPELKVSMRDWLFWMLKTAGLIRFEDTPLSSLTIITFHRVLPTTYKEVYPLKGLAVTPEDLKWTLQQLIPHFQIERLSDALDILSSGSNRLPLLAVTFDDGQLDNLEYGVPVLTELGVPATFYIPTAFVGSNRLLWHDTIGFAWLQSGGAGNDTFKKLVASDAPDDASRSLRSLFHYLKSISPADRENFVCKAKSLGCDYPEWSRVMSWAEIESLQVVGHEIGSHARTHNLLSQQSIHVQTNEINRSFEEIRDNLGFAPTTFCYPDGNYSHETIAILTESKFKAAVSTNWGRNFSTTDRFALNRFDIDSSRFLDRYGKLSCARMQFRFSKYQTGVGR